MIRSVVFVGGLALSALGAAMILATMFGVGPAGTGDATCLWCVADEALDNLLNGLGTLAAGALAVGGAVGGPMRDAAQSAYDGVSAMGRGAVASGGAMGRGAGAVADTLTTPANTAMSVARDAARDAYNAAADTARDAMTPDYVPGTSPVPQPGDTYNFPGLGKATVNSVDHHSSSSPMFPGTTTKVHTDRGTITHHESPYGGYTNSSRRN
jgi:hypothetical protein